jgi:hypothetical protein
MPWLNLLRLSAEIRDKGADIQVLILECRLESAKVRVLKVNC